MRGDSGNKESGTEMQSSMNSGIELLVKLSKLTQGTDCTVDADFHLLRGEGVRWNIRVKYQGDGVLFFTFDTSRGEVSDVVLPAVLRAVETFMLAEQYLPTQYMKGTEE